MQHPADQFGAFLRSLRKERRLGADRLALSIRKSRTYIYGWEQRADVRPPPEVLRQVADALDLSESDREALTKLAALRAIPEGDPDANLFRAVLEIPHDWPSEPPAPDPHSERAKPLVDAMAWYLAGLAFWREDILPPFWRTPDRPITARFKCIRWPDPLVRLGIVRLVEEPDAQLEIPEAILRQEMPFIEQLREPVTPLDGHTQSLGMARVYRRLLFGDPERARSAARLIEHWSYDRDQQSSDRITIKVLQSPGRPPSGTGIIGDINCRTVAVVLQRDLAFDLWHFGVDGRGDRPLEFPWYCQWDPADWAALRTLGLVTRENVTDYRHRQWLRDAWFTLTYGHPAGVLNSMRDEFKVKVGSEPELERQLTACELDASMRTKVMGEPWRLSAVRDRNLIRRYLYMLEEFAVSLEYEYPDSQRAETAPPDRERSVPSVQRAKGSKPPRKPKKGKTRNGKT